MRAFTAPPSDHDSEMGDGTDKEAEQDRDRAQELGAAAPAAEDDKKYFEKQRRERRQSHMRKTESKRGRGEIKRRRNK